MLGFLFLNQSCKKNELDIDTITNLDSVGLGFQEMKEEEISSFRTFDSFDQIREILIDSLDSGTLFSGVLRQNKLVNIPNIFELPNFTPVGDQKKANSCVPWSGVYGCYSYILSRTLKKNVNELLQSPDYAYFKMLEMSKTKCDDNFKGFNFFELREFLMKNGSVHVSSWPIQKPEKLCYEADKSLKNMPTGALVRDILSYNSKNSEEVLFLYTLKQILLTNTPIEFSILIKDDFIKLINKNSIVNADNNTGKEIGIHAMIIIGYDDAKKAFRIQNSWGTGWGDNGRSWIDYNYLYDRIKNDPTNSTIAIICLNKKVKEYVEGVGMMCNYNEDESKLYGAGPNTNGFGGQATGVEFQNWGGLKLAKFSKMNHSRIEFNLNNVIPDFPPQISPQGTFEVYINVQSSYIYQDYVQSDINTACILTTDNGGLDTHWEGSMRLFANIDGTLYFAINSSKYSSSDPDELIALNTNFRFNQWHRIGISYGNKGMYIYLDGKQVASDINKTRSISNGGGHYYQNDRPTIGETYSYFPWGEQRWGYGFEGYVYKVRASSIQKDIRLSL